MSEHAVPCFPAAGQVQALDLASSEDEALVARARTGDRRAFRVLVGRYEARVVAVVTGMLGATGEVNDVAQETFIQLYESLDRFRGDARLQTYLTRIAMNRSLDALRRRKRWLRRFVSRDDEAGAVAVEGASDHGLTQADPGRERLLQGALERLSPKHRAVIVLRVVEGYSTRETAELLGIAYGTVLSRLSRAQDMLRSWLTPHLDELLEAPGGQRGEGDKSI